MPSNTGQYGDNDYQLFLLRNSLSNWSDKLVNRFSSSCYGNTKKMAANFEWRTWLRLYREGDNSLWKKQRFSSGEEEGKEFLALETADKGAERYLRVCSTFRRW